MSVPSAERPGHRATTRHAQAIYPFMAAGGLGSRGIFIGRDSGGGAFCYDPWALYADGRLDDPNAIVLGKLGQGKSALVKTLLWRMLLFGRRAFVLDVKREYGPLCAAAGVAPISLMPGGGVRLNPLASRPEEHAQLDLLRAVAITALGGPLTQVEAAALREALRTVRAAGREPTLPDIAALLFSPPAALAEALRSAPEALARRRPPRRARASRTSARDRCAECSTGPTTPGLDLDAKLLVLDLHAVRDSPAVGILMACATAWMSALLARMAERPGPRAADQRRRRVVEDRPAHGARRVVSVELQARAAVRGDEPGRAAQARRPAGGGRRRLARGADRRGADRRRLDADRLPPGREPGPAHPGAARTVGDRGGAASRCSAPVRHSGGSARGRSSSSTTARASRHALTNTDTGMQTGAARR